MSIEEREYPNLVRVFYLNMELSTTRLDRIIINVGGVPIEFDVGDLNSILRTKNKDLEIYTLLEKNLCSAIFSMLMRLRTFVRIATFPMILSTFPSIANPYPIGLSISQHLSTCSYSKERTC